MEVIYERVAAIDVGKKEIAVTVRVPGQGPGAARGEVTRKYKTFYPVLQVMVAWLVDNRVTHVTMESTGVYWRPVFHALCDTDWQFEILLVNAAHVKNVPGRKSDVMDSQWLAQLLEVGLLRGSFIPPADIAAIREVTRYRKKLTQARTSELQRLGKVCEDARLTGPRTSPLTDTKQKRTYPHEPPSQTFLGERYRRLVKRRGKLKALVAVARSILVIVWHLLNDPTARFHDLGADYHSNRIDTDRKVRNHLRQLQALGYTVTLNPIAA